MAHRAHVAEHRAFLIRQEVERKTEIERRREEAERTERERVAKLERERVEHLLGLAQRLSKAEQIRALATSLEAALVGAADVVAWKRWAHAVADRLDPRALPLWRACRRGEDRGAGLASYPSS